MQTTTTYGLKRTDAGWRQRHPDPAFAGDAYLYLPTDAVPTYDQLEDDPVCPVKLFHPVGAFTCYVFACTDYPLAMESQQIPGEELSPVVTCWLEGVPVPEFGDSSLEELARVQRMTLPIERDLFWKPKRLSEIRN